MEESKDKMEVNEDVANQNTNREDFEPRMLVSYDRNGRKRPGSKAGYRGNRWMNNGLDGNNSKEKYGKADSRHGEHTERSEK
ncbi:hypothetical protein ACOSQ4_009908 [Xanthoceras sorbifolium]